MTSRRAFFTICSENYMAYARTLAHSLKRCHPDAPFFVVLADDVSTPADLETLGIQIIRLEALDLPTLADMVIRYSVMELNTAVKPAAILHLMQAQNFDQIVYLDPDILCVSPLTELIEQLETGGADCILTPHANSPLEDGRDPDDRRLLQTGAYNLGFCAFRRTASALDFLAWWHRRLETECLVDLPNGLFVDQKFMDLAPSYMDRVEVLKHNGYNAAYWNLLHRPVTRSAQGEWSAGADPLRFFHFSGVVPGDPSVFSKHQNRFTRDNIDALAALLDQYLTDLERFDHARWSAKPYAYDTLDGARIDRAMRAVYRDTHRRAPGTPPDAAALRALCLEPSNVTGLNRYCEQVWRLRADLQTAFDIHSRRGLREFTAWLYAHGVREMGLDENFLPRLQPLDRAIGQASAVARSIRTRLSA